MDIEICYWFHALLTGHKCWNKNWGDMDLFELWFSPALGPVVGLLSHMVALSSVQSPSHVQIIAILWTAACQAALSITNSRSFLKLMSIESVMPCNHLILCPHLLPSIFPSNRVFSNELVLHIRCPKYWSFSFSISPSYEYSNIQGWFPLRLTGLISLQSKGLLRVFFLLLLLSRFSRVQLCTTP